MKTITTKTGIIILMMAAMMLTFIGAKAQLTSGLVAYYSFDNLADGTGLNPDAVLQDGATLAAGTSKLPYSLSSMGANLLNPGYITIPQPNQFNFGSGSFSVAGWVRLQHTNSVTVMGTTLDGTNATGWRVVPLTNGNWSVIYDTDTQSPQQIGTGPGPINHWVNGGANSNLWLFVALTVNTTTGVIQGYSGQATLQANGSSNGAPTLIVESPYSFTPGGSVTNSNPFYLANGFNACWDEFRAWNRMITPAEVDQLYNNGNVMYPCVTPAISYQDSDNDGYGKSSVTSFACPKLSGYSYYGHDCDDNNSAFHGDATGYVDAW